MLQIPIYYINLASRPDRREFMEDQFKKLGLAAERIDAVTPADLLAEQREIYCNPNRRWSMTEGRYACNLSHLRAWETLLRSSEPRALVLEDDVTLSPSLPRFLEALARSQDRLDVVRIEKFSAGQHYYRAVDTWVLPDIGLRECLSRDVGAAGYVMLAEAAGWLREQPSFHTTLVDDFLFSPFSRVGWRLSVRYTDPALCQQLGYGVEQTVGSSSLNGEEDSRHKTARKRHPFVKFTRHLEIWLARDIPWWTMEAAYRALYRAARTDRPFKAD